MMVSKGHSIGINEMSLMSLKVSGAVGAAALSAKDINITLPIDYSSTSDVFFHTTLDTSTNM